MGRACNTSGEKLNGKGKRSLLRPRPRLVNNITMDLRCVGWGGMDCIDLAEVRD
jgi:hypothetical protein